MSFAVRLGLHQSRASIGRLSYNCCYASTEIEKGTRKKRKRGLRRKKRNEKPTRDLQLEMKDAILAEETRWKAPATEDSIHQIPTPLLTRMLLSITSRMFEVNPMASEIMKTVFQQRFTDSRSVVDFLEFRLLETDDYSNLGIVDFFVEFGYVVKSEFVLSEKPIPIYCKVLQPPFHQNLPKIVLSSLRIEDLTEEVQKIIKQRFESWKSLAPKYLTTALGCCSTPWELPDKAEMDLIFKDSEFAAWCLIHGFSPSCIAMSVNEMQKSKNQVGTNPTKVTLESILETVKNESPLNPAYRDPIWGNDDGSSKIVATVAEACIVALRDDKVFNIPGSHIAFIERSIVGRKKPTRSDASGFEEFSEEDYNHNIDEKLISYMHGSIEASLYIDFEMREIHKATLAKAKQNGRVLTLDGSNEDDEETYEQYLQEVHTRFQRLTSFDF
eukprot:g7705.t1